MAYKRVMWHLTQIIGIIGDPPEELLAQANAVSLYFNDDGKLIASLHEG